jgi:hypothetical protein
MNILTLGRICITVTVTLPGVKNRKKRHRVGGLGSKTREGEARRCSWSVMHLCIEK